MGGGANNVTFDSDMAPQAGADAAPATPAAEGEVSDSGGGTWDDFSTTTEQEEGVQESDIIKNDGQYIYVLADSTLRIVQADPGEALQELSSTALEGYGRDLYLLEDRVVALTLQSGIYRGGAMPMVAQESLPAPVFEPPRVQVTVIDVSDRSNPTIQSTSWFEGTLSSSRMIGADLHLVLVNYPDFFEPVIAYREGETAVAEVDADDILPDYEVAEDGSDPVSGNTVDWPDFYYPIDADGYGMTTVISLNINDPTAFGSVGVVAYPGNIYASTEALYLTDSNYDFFGSVRQTSDIYKFAFNDAGPELVAVGVVPGRILNQYSMSEYQGYLRVATTVDRSGMFGEEPSTNNVYVLAQEADELAIVGRAENLAPTEQIYSARFSGPRGYLVTFEQIDPLFTLDLSDPANPQVVGELKVPGYSTFIIEMGENHLLTVGRNTVMNGSFVFEQGIQLSIFDISDLANPQLAFTEQIGNPDAWSEALYNPKALTYFAAQDLLALPVEIWEYAYGWPAWDGVVTVPDEPETAVADAGIDTDTEPAPTPEPVAQNPVSEESFNGLYVYRVTPEDGFEALGQMSTVMGEGYYYNSFTRGVFMNGNVFAVTDRGVVGAPVTAVGTTPWEVLFP